MCLGRIPLGNNTNAKVSSMPSWQLVQNKVNGKLRSVSPGFVDRSTTRQLKDLGV